MTFNKTSSAQTYRIGGGGGGGGGRRSRSAALLLLLSLSLSPPPSCLAAETERQDSLDELLSRWSAGGQDSRDEEPLSQQDEPLSRWSASAAGRLRDWRDERRSRLIDTYARGTSTAAAETPLHRDRARSVVTVARNGRPDGTPCPTVEGLWLSTNLETAFDMRATGLAGRLDVRAVGSDWTGGAESVFGDRGPVTAIVGQPSTGTAVTWVGHCRASHGVDTMTGVWVIASPAKNKLDHHLAVQPIPDTLHRLQFE